MIGLFMAAQDEAHSARRLSNLPVSLCAQPAMQSETTRRSRGGDEERTRPANDSLGRWGHHRPGDNPRALELLAGNSGEGRAPPRGHRTRSGPVCRDLGRWTQRREARCQSSPRTIDQAWCPFRAQGNTALSRGLRWSLSLREEHGDRRCDRRGDWGSYDLDGGPDSRSLCPISRLKLVSDEPLAPQCGGELSSGTSSVV